MKRKTKEPLEAIPLDIQNLIEKLKVRQAELETQVRDLQLSQIQFQETLNQYQRMFENMHTPAVICQVVRSQHGEIIDWIPLKVNKAGETTPGARPFSEVVGRPASEIFQPDIFLPALAKLKEVMRTHEGCFLESTFNTGVNFISSISPIDETTIVMTSTDITERKRMEEALARAKADLEEKVKERTLELSQANEQLKQYARRIVDAQEEERKRIAYELHDDTAQYLSILKLQLDSILQSRKIRSPDIIEKLQYLNRDAGRAVDDVRRYSHELRPAVLDNLGLRAALEQICEDINKLQQFEIRFNADGEEPAIQNEIKLGLFRIVQETISNIRKHAKASLAAVDMVFKGNRIRISVTDNGTGFNLQEAKNRSNSKGSLGLMSMQERAKLIGAFLEIWSEPGKGTAVTIDISL